MAYVRSQVTADGMYYLLLDEVQMMDCFEDSFKKIVITKDIVQPNYDDYGILTVNIYDFLLDPRILER